MQSQRISFPTYEIHLERQVPIPISLTQPTLLHPGQSYRFEIDLQATAQVFQAGHQLRVEVTSSDFPRYDRNLNTGDVFGTGIHGQVANNTLFYGGSRASHILLPVRSW